jgi:hypothetical protein
MSRRPRRKIPISDGRCHRALIAALVHERKRAGFTQETLSRALGRQDNWVCFMENGKRRIIMDEFLTLARIIGFDPFCILRKLDAALTDWQARRRGLG